MWSHAGIPAPTDMRALDLRPTTGASQLNLTQTTLLASHAVTVMLQGGGGSDASDVVGFRPRRLGRARSTSPCKAAVIGRTRALAVRYATDGIRVKWDLPHMVDAHAFTTTS